MKTQSQCVTKNKRIFAISPCKIHGGEWFIHMSRDARVENKE